MLLHSHGLDFHSRVSVLLWVLCHYSRDRFFLHNTHALTMRNVSGVAYVAVTWIPNLVIQAGLCIYFSLAQLEDKSG